MASLTRLGTYGSIALVSLGLLTAPLAAQVHFTPFAGAYYSANSLGNLQDPTLAGAEIVQTSGVVVGGVLDLPLGNKFGVELGGSFGLSDGRFQITVTSGSNEFTGFVDESGYIAHASLTGRLNATQTGNFFLFAGPGISIRGGDAWTAPNAISPGLKSSDRMAFGGTAGFGVLARVAPGFTLDVRAEAFVYTFDPDGSTDPVTFEGAAFDSAINADIIVKVGIRLPGN
jgi:hypothetical protein